MLNRFFGTQCVRPGCAHHNPKGSEFCEKCGISLGFSRPAILEGNRWSAAPDEMAAFFRFKAMQGFFTKSLHVPAGMRAWVLQGDTPESQTLALPEGEHTTETLFQRLNNFFRSPHGEVLVARTDALPVSFDYKDLLSAELLPLQLNTTLQLKLGDLIAFRRRFMLQDGVVTTSTLHDILRAPVRQALAEAVGTRHVDEMVADAQLRDKLDRALRVALEPLLADLGLRLEQVSAITLHHEALDAQNQLKGRLWLLRREAQVHDEHDKALDELYDQRQWAAIKKREAEIRRRRHEAGLSKDEADVAQTLRLLDLEQYERIASAKTRQQAISLGATDAIDALEHDYAAKQRQREHQALGEQYVADDEATQWRYIQDLARVRREGDLKLAGLRKDEEMSLERERIQNALERMSALAGIEHAKLLSTEAERQAQTVIHLERMAKVAVREQQLEDSRHAAALDELALAKDIRRQEARRAQQLEDALLQSKVSKLELETKSDKTRDGLSELEALMRLDHQDDLNDLNRKLLERRELAQIDNERLDRELDRKLLSQASERDADLAKANAELQRITVLGTLPVEALIVLADQPAKFDALVKLGTITQYARMSPEQIKVLPGSAPQAAAPSIQQPAAHLSPAALEEQVRARLQDERAWMSQLRAEDERKNKEFLRVLETLGVKLGDVGIAQAHSPVPQGVPAPMYSAGHAVIHPAMPAQPQYQAAPVFSSPTANPAAGAASAGHLHMPVIQCRNPKCGFVNMAGADFCGKCLVPLK